MSGTTAATCLWVGLLMRLAAGGQSMLTTSAPLTTAAPLTTIAPPMAESNLRKLTRTEQKHRFCDKALESMYSLMGALETKLKALEIRPTDTALPSRRVRVNGASTYTRWGRSTCSNNSELVYSGVAGGAHSGHTGSAANLLCLTLFPQTDSTAVSRTYAYLYGAEYRDIPVNNQNHDVPCAVCRVTQPTTIMIPSIHTCPQGWSTQYTGHLAAGYYRSAAASEFVCLDKDPERALGGRDSRGGNLLYYVTAQCGSLPCPPYVNGKIVLCVVCSK